MTQFRSQFRCINPACSAAYAIDRVIFRCEACNDLLDVEHDRAAWRAAGDASFWRERFAARWRSPQLPDASGVWGKREWVLPELELSNIVSFAEGATHLMPAARYGDEFGVPELYIKMCGNTHTGSFKDLGMTVLVSAVKQLRARGADIPAMICASTGDTSAALAAYGAAAGIPTVVMLPRGKISTAQLVQPLANGATVLSLDTDFDGCMAMVQRVTEVYGLYLANSMNSLRIEGQKTVAYDIVQQLGWQVPDWVIIPGGNLGNVSALAKGFEDLEAVGLIERRPRICCAQAERANPLFRAYQNGWADLEPQTALPTQASAIRIGNPVSFAKAVRALKAFAGVVASVSEQELADAASRADRSGTYACPHTGVALAAFEQLATRGEIKRNDRVVVISTAHGLKFTEFKVGYHEDRLDDVRAAYANRPIEVAPDLEAIWDAIRRDRDLKTGN